MVCPQYDSEQSNMVLQLFSLQSRRDGHWLLPNPDLPTAVNGDTDIQPVLLSQGKWCTDIQPVLLSQGKWCIDIQHVLLSQGKWCTVGNSHFLVLLEFLFVSYSCDNCLNSPISPNIY